MGKEKIYRDFKLPILQNFNIFSFADVSVLIPLSRPFGFFKKLCIKSKFVRVTLNLLLTNFARALLPAKSKRKTRLSKK